MRYFTVGQGTFGIEPNDYRVDHPYTLTLLPTVFPQYVERDHGMYYIGIYKKIIGFIFCSYNNHLLDG